MSSVRASRVVIRSVLDKYLDEKLAARIFWDICNQDDADRRNMIGMTWGEYKERFDDDEDVSLVWADDTKAGFGRQGDSVYGNSDDCVICRVVRGSHYTKLYVWTDPLTSDLPFVKAAMAEYHKRQAAKEAK